MKNTFKIVLLTIFTVGLSSCDNLLDVEIDTTIEGDLSFVTDEADLKSTEDHGFYGSKTVDVLNEDLSDYEDLIQDFNTREITLEVVAIDSAGTSVSGIILRQNSEFGISNANAAYTWTLLSDWPIEEGFTLTIDEASYDAIDDILDDMLPVTFTADGTCNKGNIHITLNYGIDVLVKSNPL